MNSKPNELTPKTCPDRRSRGGAVAIAALAMTWSAATWPTALGAQIAAPELPRVVPESRNPYAGKACSVTLDDGASITSALRSARGGTVVCLTAGATYEPFQLPVRRSNDTGWIVLRTETSPVSEGTRIRPSDAASLAKIVQSRNGLPALTTSPGASHYMLQGIEVTTGPAVNKTYVLVALGSSGPEQDAMDEVPGPLILAQMYIHGSTNGEMQRCVGLNSGATAIVDSWLAECHGKGYDSQAIGGWNGPGPHLIRNNYLEGAGENVMWGGATPSIPGLVAADITFQRNHVYTPIAWKGKWTKKNLFELKNAVRVLVEDNVFDGSWLDAQTGVALLFKSINDQGNCNWCRTTDVTVRRSLVTRAGGGIVFSGAENYNSVGTVDSIAKRFLIQDVVFEKLNIAPYDGSGRGVQIGSRAQDILMDRTVIVGTINQMMVLDNLRPSPRTGFTNSVWTHGFYAATGEGGTGPGTGTMRVAMPGFKWSNMTVIRTNSLDPMPPGTTVVQQELASSLARRVRATVSEAVKGVVIAP